MSHNSEGIENDLPKSRISSASSKRNLEQHSNFVNDSHTNESSIETKINGEIINQHPACTFEAG